MFEDTLQQLAVAYSKTQQELINRFAKDTPFLKTIPYITSTHGLMNQYEDVTDIDGAEFKELGAPYKDMSVNTSLVKEDMGIMGGLMEINAEKASQLTNTTKGEEAATKYFAKRSPIVLNDAGKKVEKHLIYNYLYRKIFSYNKKCDPNERTLIDAGGTGNNTWSVLAIRQQKEENCGLLSPVGDNKDEILTMEWLNGGSLHKLKDGTLGYAAVWKALMGYQMARADNVGAIFNITDADASKLTSTMLNDLIARIDGNSSDTVIVMNKGLQARVYDFKTNQLVVGCTDKNFDTRFDLFNGITLLGTSSMLRGTESHQDMPW